MPQLSEENVADRLLLTENHTAGPPEVTTRHPTDQLAQAELKRSHLIGREGLHQTTSQHIRRPIDDLSVYEAPVHQGGANGFRAWALEGFCQEGINDLIEQLDKSSLIFIWGHEG